MLKKFVEKGFLFDIDQAMAVKNVRDQLILQKHIKHFNIEVITFDHDAHKKEFVIGIQTTHIIIYKL